MSARVVTDAIHGSIRLEDDEWKVVDTASFQRLRNLKQLQMAQLTYPNATHTRFAHSLGVFSVMKRVLEEGAKALKLDDEQQMKNLRLAALLHDVGHYPYSHLMEGIDNVTLTEDFVSGGKKEIDLSAVAAYPAHEEVGRTIVTKREDLVAAIGDEVRAKEIADLFTGVAPGPLSKLIHSSLDMDRFDFLLRDANATGVPYGSVDLPYLLANVAVSKSGRIGFSYKAMSAAEQFLFARFFMYKVVYFHKTTFGFEEACRQLLRRCKNEKLYDVPVDGNAVLEWVTGEAFPEFTDGWVDHVVRRAANDPKADSIVKALARCIVYRKPPCLLREVSELKDLSQPKAAELCKSFRIRCQDRIPALAKTFGLDERLFLFAGPKSVKLEARASRLTQSTARKSIKLEDEEREELVLIFEKGNKGEPTPLVDIPGSIANVASNVAYQFARLYLVTDDEGLSDKVREQVEGWDL